MLDARTSFYGELIINDINSKNKAINQMVSMYSTLSYLYLIRERRHIPTLRNILRCEIYIKGRDIFNGG